MNDELRMLLFALPLGALLLTPACGQLNQAADCVRQGRQCQDEQVQAVETPVIQPCSIGATPAEEPEAEQLPTTVVVYPIDEGVESPVLVCKETRKRKEKKEKKNEHD